MIKVVAAIRRRPGMAQAEYFDYIENVHGKLARDNPLGLSRYVQNHVKDAAFGVTGDASHLTVLPRDSVTELWFEDFPALGRTFADPYTQQVLGPDGKNFSDLPTALSLLTSESGEWGNTAQGLKIMYFLKAAQSATPEVFAQEWTAADLRARTSGAILGGIRSHAISPPPGAPQGGGDNDYFGGKDMIAYDGIQSLYVAPETAIQDFRAYEAIFTDGSAPWLDRSRSFWLLTKEVKIIG